MNIARLHEGKLQEACEALSSAFHDDPLQTFVFPDPDERRAHSPAHFRPLLKYGLLYGHVYTTEGRCSGASVCLSPGQTEVTQERAAASGLDSLPTLIGQAPAERFLSVLAHLEPFHLMDMPEPHWYVMVVGIEPGWRGRGLGRLLLEPMLAQAREFRHACYLETAQPSNVGFYEHLGFRVLRYVVEPVSGLPLWTFRWDAA